MSNILKLLWTSDRQIKSNRIETNEGISNFHKCQDKICSLIAWATDCNENKKFSAKLNWKKIYSEIIDVRQWEIRTS